jgi:hypothetical protein
VNDPATEQLLRDIFAAPRQPVGEEGEDVAAIRRVLGDPDETFEPAAQVFAELDLLPERR